MMRGGRVPAAVPLAFSAALALSAVLALAAVLCVGGCSSGRPDWVIHTRVVFLSQDLRTPRPAPPVKSFRLWCPFVVGALYGGPGTGDLVAASVQPDYRVAIDLNRSVKGLRVSLEPTHFMLPFMRIVPREARIARFAPSVLQANGIDRIGTTDWVDLDTHERLLLVYVDRPALITGHTVARGAPIRYDVRIAQAGFAWIGERDLPGGGLAFSAMPQPRHLVLAVTPSAD